MSQQLRQSELFAGNDWTVIYRAFSQINFNAYDFASIRSAMKSYIQLNYPENFNDWTDSSEFVAILDLVAYLGQSLAFRMDINTRENFIDSARRKESVLKLARFLSYKSRRNMPAQGLVKIVGIKTSDTIQDSMGNNLSGKTILWNDSSNSNWKDQWFTVLNEALISTNTYGTPLKKATISNVPTELYRMNNISYNAGSFRFTSYVDNVSKPFELINMNFSEKEGFVEMNPNNQTPFQFCYRNDSNGNDSPNTGFFMYFKQGTLQKYDYLMENPLPNTTITLPDSNINDSDIWVQSVNDAGYILDDGDWTRVGYVPTDDITKVILTTDNITYNNIDTSVRNIFQDVTLTDDNVMIRFGDGLFGSIPTGNIRVWARISDNSNISIKPENMRNITVSFPYLNSNNSTHQLTLTFSLQETVSNSSTSEDIDDIRRRASNLYNTQGRMVSGNDYNIMPATNNIALKVKAVNRIYSGQSRYIDLNDPTGSYQSTNVFSDDGLIYSQNFTGYKEIPQNMNYSSGVIIDGFLKPLMMETYMRDFINNEWLVNQNYNFSLNLTWNSSTVSNFSSTGTFLDSNGNPIGVDTDAESHTNEFLIRESSMIKIQDPSGDTQWVTVSMINPLGSTTPLSNGAGPIRLNESITNGSKVIQVLPFFDTSLSLIEKNKIITALDNKRTFAINYDFRTNSWNTLDATQISNTEYDYSTLGSNKDSSWIIKCEYSSVYWRIYSRGKRYVFESAKDVKFFFTDSYKTVDPQTGKIGTDEIKLLKFNFPKINGKYQDFSFKISGTYMNNDGSMDPRKVDITFRDTDYDGQPDDPESFITINKLLGNNLIFHKRTLDNWGFIQWIPTSLPLYHDGITVTSYSPKGTDGTDGTFITVGDDDPSNYTVDMGFSNMDFQWRHFAPSDHRIDPSVTNIIDIFVLTNEYYNNMKSWYNDGMDPLSIPSYSSEADLQISYKDMENYKMFSDELIWKPVKFKFIGGQYSDESLKFSIKVVKNPNSVVSDGEIKTNILNSVSYFFDVNRWDFGETFFASELMSFIHIQLIDGVSSVAIVPQSENQSFGDLFQISSLPDELFFSTLSVSDIQIVPAFTSNTLRIS